MESVQGLFFVIELRGGSIRFKILDLIPWARVHLSDVEYFRISRKSEYYDCMRRGESTLFWPVSIWGYRRRMAPIYILKDARKNRKIFFRASSGYHYKIRSAIGRAKNNDPADAPSPW